MIIIKCLPNNIKIIYYTDIIWEQAYTLQRVDTRLKWWFWWQNDDDFKMMVMTDFFYHFDDTLYNTITYISITLIKVDLFWINYHMSLPIKISSNSLSSRLCTDPIDLWEDLYEPMEKHDVRKQTNELKQTYQKLRTWQSEWWIVQRWLWVDWFKKMRLGQWRSKY